LFAYDNYVGKPKAYVEDDLLDRMDKYETAVKQWGIETREGAYNMLFSPKTLAGTGAGALLSTLFGAPLPAVLVGAAGAAIELSRMGIYLGKQRFMLRKMLNENPVSYLSYAKEELGSGRKIDDATDFGDGTNIMLWASHGSFASGSEATQSASFACFTIRYEIRPMSPQTLPRLNLPIRKAQGAQRSSWRRCPARRR
jgi:hypothetical protein